jgi:integrase
MGRKGQWQGIEMATLEQRGDSFRLIFYYRNERFTRALKADSKRKAEELKKRLEGNLELLQKGRLEYSPERDDLPTLLLTDGKLNARPEAAKRITLGEFFDQYTSNRPPGKEGGTIYTEDIHIEHLKRLLDKRTALVEVPAKLQSYVTARCREVGRRGELVSHVTVKKELGTLSSLWNKWGMRAGLVSFPLTLKNLEYTKAKEKLPFQTWEQIERHVVRGQLSAVDQEELWDALFLTVSEVEELLGHVKKVKYRWKNSHFPWVYPMFVFCAHTGARRSEMLRSRVEDLDFEAGEVLIREKKKDRSKVETQRRVPMTTQLRTALQEWLAVHPGGPLTFCKEAGEPLTAQMATHYLRWTLDGSKWKVVKGWHIFRHSFISNLACRGASERVIMALAGHLNRETTRRYTHLVPSTVQDAMRLLFGQGSLVAQPCQLVVGDQPAAPVG